MNEHDDDDDDCDATLIGGPIPPQRTGDDDALAMLLAGGIGARPATPVAAPVAVAAPAPAPAPVMAMPPVLATVAEFRPLSFAVKEAEPEARIAVAEAAEPPPPKAEPALLATVAKIEPRPAAPAPAPTLESLGNPATERPSNPPAPVARIELASAPVRRAAPVAITESSSGLELAIEGRVAAPRSVAIQRAAAATRAATQGPEAAPAEPGKAEALSKVPSGELLAELSGEIHPIERKPKKPPHPARLWAERNRRVIAAVAGVLLLAILWPRSHPPLPEYAIEGPFGGTEKEGRARFRAASDFRVVARPEREAAEPPVAQFIIEGPNGLAFAPEITVKVDDRGVVRLEARASALFDRPGRYTVYTAVGAEVDEPLESPDAMQVKVVSKGGQWLQTTLDYVP